jgi:hypothetical protein
MAINLSKNDVKSTDVHPNVAELLQNNQLFPPAEEIDLISGKGMWNIKGVRCWADTYLNACKIYDEIIDYAEDY